MSENRVTNIVAVVIETGGDRTRLTNLTTALIETGGDRTRLTNLTVAVIYQIPFGSAQPQINLIM